MQEFIFLKSRSQQTLSGKDQVVNIFGSVGDEVQAWFNLLLRAWPPETLPTGQRPPSYLQWSWLQTLEWTSKRPSPGAGRWHGDSGSPCECPLPPPHTSPCLDRPGWCCLLEAQDSKKIFLKKGSIPRYVHPVQMKTEVRTKTCPQQHYAQQ